MKKRHIVIISAVAVVVLGIFGSALSDSGGKEPLAIQTEPARRASITQKVNATGQIQPKRQVKISADVSAKIIHLAVREGEHVEKGQLLVELDRLRFEANVESEEANVRAAQGNAKLIQANKLQAERVLNRAKELYAKKLESQSSVDSAKAAYDVEVARYESTMDQIAQARGMLKQARDNLSKTTIYAPMTGTISALEREQGEIAIGSQFQEDVIMIVADLGEMEALVSVDENDITHVALKQPAEIKVDALLGEVPLPGEVTEIASSAKPALPGEAQQKTEFEVRVAVTGATGKLRPGMTTSVDVVTDTRADALTVPIQSVTVRTLDQLRSKDGKTEGFVAGADSYVPIVFVVKDGVAHARQVKTGIQSDEFIEIVDGLKEGETVVSGSYRAISRDLANGDPVTIEKPTELAGAP